MFLITALCSDLARSVSFLLQTLRMIFLFLLKLIYNSSHQIYKKQTHPNLDPKQTHLSALDVLNAISDAIYETLVTNFQLTWKTLILVADEKTTIFLL